MQLREDFSELPSDERRELVSCVRRWCYLAAEAVLDPRCEIFQIPGIDGLISYRVAFGCAIAYGDPVCAEENFLPLVDAFQQQCSKKGLPVIYATASERFKRWAFPNHCEAFIEFGREVFLDPFKDPRARTGTHASLVRRKVRHSLKEGVTVEEYYPSDPALEAAIEKVGEEWLQGRKGPQLYLSRVRLFDDRQGKRWFYAKREGRLIGCLSLNQLQIRRGYLLNRLMVLPDAPNGTPELLVTHTIDKLREENCHFVTFGPIAASKLGSLAGLGKLSCWVAHKSYQSAVKIFHLEGHAKFWEKFHPESQPNYILFSRARVGLRELLCMARGMNLSL